MWNDRNTDGMVVVQVEVTVGRMWCGMSKRIRGGEVEDYMWNGQCKERLWWWWWYSGVRMWSVVLLRVRSMNLGW